MAPHNMMPGLTWMCRSITLAMFVLSSTHSGHPWWCRTKGICWILYNVICRSCWHHSKHLTLLSPNLQSNWRCVSPPLEHLVPTPDHRTICAPSMHNKTTWPPANPQCDPFKHHHGMVMLFNVSMRHLNSLLTDCLKQLPDDAPLVMPFHVLWCYDVPAACRSNHLHTHAGLHVDRVMSKWAHSFCGLDCFLFRLTLWLIHCLGWHLEMMVCIFFSSFTHFYFGNLNFSMQNYAGNYISHGGEKDRQGLTKNRVLVEK